MLLDFATDSSVEVSFFAACCGGCFCGNSGGCPDLALFGVLTRMRRKACPAPSRLRHPRCSRQHHPRRPGMPLVYSGAGNLLDPFNIERLRASVILWGIGCSAPYRETAGETTVPLPLAA